MAKFFERYEIDFDTGYCVETTRQKVAYIAERIRTIKNPYTGNKRKLLVDIFQSIENYGVKYDTFLDLFSGSACVSIAAKYLGKKVISNDLMNFAKLHAEIFVLDHNDWFTIQEMKNLRKHEPNTFGTLVRDYYGDRFTVLETICLDQYRKSIDELYTGIHCKIALVQILHYVMTNCFLGGRLNHGQVLADREHRLKHIKNKGYTMTFKKIPRYEFNIDIEPMDHKCYSMDAIDLLVSSKSDNIDLCYIDPPYGGQQSDYYYMYMFFEDYIRGYVNTDPDENYQKFVSTKNYYEHFSKLLEAAKKIPVLVLSYNESSWGKIENILSVIQKIGRKINVQEIKYSYKYRGTDNPGKEYIIIAE